MLRPGRADQPGGLIFSFATSAGADAWSCVAFAHAAVPARGVPLPCTGPVQLAWRWVY